MDSTHSETRDALVSIELPEEHLAFLRLLADAHATSPAEELRRIVDDHVDRTLAGELGDQIRANKLHTELGSALVAAMTGNRDISLPGQWATGAARPTGGEALRLELGYLVWNLLKQGEGEGEGVSRAWFVGANPLLGERTPVSAIREYEKDAVLRAAQGFLNGEQDV